MYRKIFTTGNVKNLESLKCVEFSVKIGELFSATHMREASSNNEI